MIEPKNGVCAKMLQIFWEKKLQETRSSPCTNNNEICGESCTKFVFLGFG